MLRLWFRNHPYWLFCIVLLVLFVPLVCRLPALNDLFVHAATIERLRADFWHPRDPMVDAPGLGNPYFSPYMVFWAAIAKITGWGTFVVLRIAALSNLVLFLGGFGLYVRAISRRKWAPVWSLLCCFFLWGTSFIYWSGFISLPSLIASLAYPSTFAVGMSLVAWAALHRMISGPRSGREFTCLSVVIVIATVTVLLSHQFTALGTCIYAAFVVIRVGRCISRRIWLALASIVVLSTLLVLAWPWYGLFSATGGVQSFNDVHEPLYRDLVGRYGLLLLTLPALYVRFRADRQDPLVWSVLACSVIYAAGGISDQFFLGRILPTAAILSQIAAGVALAEWMADGARGWKRAYPGVIMVALGAGLVFQSGTLNLIVPGSYPSALDARFHSRMTKGDYTWIRKHVDFGETVMTVNWDARVMAPGYGVFTVMTAWPDPTLGPAEKQRRVDSGTVFRSKTSVAQRAQIMKRYDAHWVIVTRKHKAVIANDPHFVWVAVRPDTGPREETMSNGPQELYRFVGS